jgi:hypothetical protein
MEEWEHWIHQHREQRLQERKIYRLIRPHRGQRMLGRNKTARRTRIKMGKVIARKKKKKITAKEGTT